MAKRPYILGQFMIFYDLTPTRIFFQVYYKKLQLTGEWKREILCNNFQMHLANAEIKLKST